ncbi:MAG: AAA family ATPase [Verrucomicrobia bacterium]|nr:AAA family ATPase [Verrucomicrobiota bacterium]
MHALRKNLEQIWDQLRGQKPSRVNSIEEIQIKGLRGIADLRVLLPFPVTVLAGPNGCGKSTVLFALASAYHPLGGGVSERTPTKLFPDFRPKKDQGAVVSDAKTAVEITFAYIANNERVQMKWARGKGKWNRSFFGRKRGSQPERVVFLRTLANLSNPSEVRSVLQLAVKPYSASPVDVSYIEFAQRILSYRYSRLSLVESGVRNLLFAERMDAAGAASSRYSEFHMSAGERSILRLSMEISKMKDALVLIDEVEAGLHPYLQQLLLLELQRLSLRNHLQIVVTTHSPTVLDSVPPEARVFLERTDANVVRREAYRDLIQKSLYGCSQDVLSVLCEDEEAEAFVRGILDVLGPKLDLLQNDIKVGRNTGKEEFPAHLETLGRFRKLGDVLFVLDGDGRAVGAKLEARAAEMGQAGIVAYLPGTEAPEVWIWKLLQSNVDQYSQILGLTSPVLADKLREIENLFSSAADKPAAIAKGKLTTLAETTARTVPEMIRLIAKTEAGRNAGDVFSLATRLEDVVRQWRASMT